MSNPYGKAKGVIGYDETVAMLKALLAGRDPVCKTDDERKVKASLIKDIAYAKKKGYQLEIPGG